MSVPEYTDEPTDESTDESTEESTELADVLADLRRRRSLKWARYEPDVLPLWVAEMDFPLAPPVAAALRDLVDRGDTGYVHPGRLPEAFAAMAATRWSLAIDPSRVHVLADVVGCVRAALEVFTRPGDAVVVETPAYPPLFWAVRHGGRRLVEVPYAADGGRPRADLERIGAALASGARAVLLCSPHNPTGVVHDRAHLEGVADLAERYGAAVLSDEVHALLTYDASFVPFGLVATERPRLPAVTLTSASKAWNVPGLKCAQLVAHSAVTEGRLRDLEEAYGFGASLFGVVAAEAAYRDGGPWLDDTVVALRTNRDFLGELLVRYLPAVRWTPPTATYLAWLDCRALGLGDDPATAFLERGRVALSPGPDFGPPGAGHARLNFATSPAILRAALLRMGALTGSK